MFDKTFDQVIIRYVNRIFNQPHGKEWRARQRRNMPLAETMLWSKLQRRQLLGYKFRRQFGVGPYSLDFYCPALKLAIECDGESHGEESIIQHDREREMNLRKLGIECVRFRNEEIYNDMTTVLERITELIMRIAPR